MTLRLEIFCIAIITLLLNLLSLYCSHASSSSAPIHLVGTYVHTLTHPIYTYNQAKTALGVSFRSRLTTHYHNGRFLPKSCTVPAKMPFIDLAVLSFNVTEN